MKREIELSFSNNIGVNMREILEISQDDPNHFRDRKRYVGKMLNVTKAFPNTEGWLYAKGYMFDKDGKEVYVVGTSCNIITFFKCKLGGETNG